MKRNIIFKLPAEALEGATEAILLGDFNDWSSENAYLLEKQEDGSFKTIVPLEAGRSYQYRFLLNDGRWVNDYNAQDYVPVSGYFVDNCVITVPETLGIEEVQPGKHGKKKGAAKTKSKVNTESGEKKIIKSSSPKAKKEKAATEKTKEKKSSKKESSKGKKEKDARF